MSGKEKIVVVIPSDALLFEGITETVENAWEKSVRRSIEHVLQGRAEGHGIDELAELVLQRRREVLSRAVNNRVELVPREIIDKSYVALGGKGLAHEDIPKMAQFGNSFYLEEYIRAAGESVKVSERGKVIMADLQARVDRGSEVELIRVEKKRVSGIMMGNGPDRKVDIMRPESVKLLEFAPGVIITDHGMDVNGKDYVAALKLGSRKDASPAINFIVVEAPSVTTKIGGLKHDKLITPLVQASVAGNLVAISVVRIKSDHLHSHIGIGSTSTHMPLLKMTPEDMGRVMSVAIVDRLSALPVTVTPPKNEADRTLPRSRRPAQPPRRIDPGNAGLSDGTAPGSRE